ncbi:hypothetical protein [Ciceribacter selenitireducens]|uniref:hypothetical protein n=1 Tax=Ciceribacter selenitireducens TaxID=448181 RepID=UPI0004AF254B|nr:hypothetical protein [Ciceribacter selenitireducens]
MERARIASNIFALICTSLLTGLLLHDMLADKRAAEHLLKVGTVTPALAAKAKVTGGRRCRYRIDYSFRADDGRQMSHRADLRCEREGWFFAKPVPLPDVLEVVYEKGNPVNFRLMLEIKRAVEPQFYMVVVCFFLGWLLFFKLASRVIAWAVKLP